MPGTTFSAANWDGYDEQSVSNPSSALTDFTLLIDVSDLSSSWKSSVQSDGADIRLTKGDGTTELAYDLIDWAYNAGSPTGWIRVKWSGTLASSGTQNVRVYAGYTPGTATAYDATETYGSDNAYRSAIECYLPLHESPSGGAPQFIDRTANSNNFSMSGTALSNAAAQVGDGVEFVADHTRYLSRSASLISATAPRPITISCWLKVDNPSSDVRASILANNFNNNNPGLYVHVERTTGSTWRQSLYSGGYVHSSTFTMDTGWHHYTWTWAADNSVTFRRDGVDNGTASRSSGGGFTDGAAIGTLTGALSGFDIDGVLDEFAVRSEIVSDAEDSLEYDQSSDNATFWGTWAWTATGGGSSIIPILMQLGI